MTETDNNYFDNTDDDDSEDNEGISVTRGPSSRQPHGRCRLKAALQLSESLSVFISHPY